MHFVVSFSVSTSSIILAYFCVAPQAVQELGVHWTAWSPGFYATARGIFCLPLFLPPDKVAWMTSFSRLLFFPHNVIRSISSTFYSRKKAPVYSSFFKKSIRLFFVMSTILLKPVLSLWLFVCFLGIC